MADRDGGLLFDAGKLTVGEYLERWLADSVKGSVKEATYANYGTFRPQTHLPRPRASKAEDADSGPRTQLLRGEVPLWSLRSHSEEDACRAAPGAIAGGD